MKTTVIFNRDDWSGKTASLTIFKNGNFKIDFMLDKKFNLKTTFEKTDLEGEIIETTSYKVYDLEGCYCPKCKGAPKELLKGFKIEDNDHLIYDGKFLMTGDIDGFYRNNENPFVAAAQVICNIL